MQAAERPPRHILYARGHASARQPLKCARRASGLQAPKQRRAPLAADQVRPLGLRLPPAACDLGDQCAGEGPDQFTGHM